MSHSNSIEEKLAVWKQSLVVSIPVGGLHSRNPVAYKWKAPFRVWYLREVVFWRLQDLLAQSFGLHTQGFDLGARILLRSGFESVASLIHLNQLMQHVLDGTLDFHVFGEKTSKLLLGSKNNTSGIESINIMTVLEKCERKYPGIKGLYADLSESAHPSYVGLCKGYSKFDRDKDEVKFSNRWCEMYGDTHTSLTEFCMKTFEHEYDEEWAMIIEKFEVWIEENDTKLEATKNGAVPQQNSASNTSRKMTLK